MNKKNGLQPVHPGEIIREDILPETGLSVTAVAKALGVSRQMVHAILAGAVASVGGNVPEDFPAVWQHSGIAATNVCCFDHFWFDR